MAKRKRESDAVTGKSSGSTSPAPAQNISPASLKGKGKAKETTSKDDGAGRKVEVVWELADGSGRWTKPISELSPLALSSDQRQVLVD